MGSDNKLMSLSPDEIEKPDHIKYKGYQQSGPSEENTTELSIKNKEIQVDQTPNV